MTAPVPTAACTLPSKRTLTVLYHQLQGSSPTRTARSEHRSRTQRTAISTAKAQSWHGTGGRQSPNLD